MSEEDLKIVRELFDKAKGNFERRGYLAPVLVAWAPERPPMISLIQGNVRNVLPSMCQTLLLSSYDRLALIVEGWIVMGRENLKDTDNWVGRMGEHPKAQTSIQIIFVSPERTYGKHAVHDETEGARVLVKEVEPTPDWTLAGFLIRGDEVMCSVNPCPCSHHPSLNDAAHCHNHALGWVDDDSEHRKVREGKGITL